MNRHKIEGLIIETCNCDLITFLDTSIYREGVDVTNPILRIYPPNWDNYINIEYNLNAITLIRPEHLAHSSLPDGVYHFVQSVCPNESTEVSFCYLNTCNKENELTDLACVEENREEVVNLLFELKLAKEITVNCGVKEGIEMYNTICKKVEKLKNKCKTC